jgi:hypothetical protein
MKSNNENNIPTRIMSIKTGFSPKAVIQQKYNTNLKANNLNQHHKTNPY